MIKVKVFSAILSRFCIGPDIRRALTGPLVLWFKFLSNKFSLDLCCYVCPNARCVDYI